MPTCTFSHGQAHLALEVTSPAIVGLNAFLASPNLP